MPNLYSNTGAGLLKTSAYYEAGGSFEALVAGCLMKEAGSKGWNTRFG